MDDYQIEFGGEKFSNKLLWDTFMEVANKRDWKLPINKRFKNPTPEHIKLIETAIIVNTGSAPEFYYDERGHYVVAAGYYNAIGA